jgi:fibronectin-binding autotransporter adhesin
VLTNNGTFSPGGALGTMATTLTGTYEQTGAGIFEATVCGDAHDQLLLGDQGDASLDGTLRIVADCDVYTDGTTYDIITAADSQQITGSFSTMELPQTAFLDFNSEYHDGVLQLTVDVEGFAPASANSLQKQIADYLDACLADAKGDLARVIGAFQLASAEEVAEAFESLSPDTYDNLTRGSAQSTRLYQDALVQRLDLARFDPFAAKDAPLNLAFGGHNGWWLNGMHRGADQDASGGYQAHNFVSSGVLGGYERYYGTTIVGGSIGYTNTDVDRDNEMARGRVEAIGGSLYGTHVWKRNFATGMLYYGSENIANDRDIHLGSEERVAQSEYSGTAFSALVTGGHKFDTRSWGLEPFGALRYIHVSEDGFTEQGAQSVNLIVDPRSTNWLGSDLGIRLNRSFQNGGWALVPELLLAWNYDFGIDDRSVTAAFEGMPSSTFTIEGQEVDQNGATLGIGLGFATVRGWGASVRYDRIQRSDFQANDLSLRLGMRF